MAGRQGPLFTVDGIGRVTSWSAAAARGFGCGEQSALGSPADELVRGSEASGHVPSLLAVPLGGVADGWAMYPAPPTPGRLDAAIEDALVRALLSESQLSLLVLDTELRVVRVSMATQALHRPGADVMGRRVDLAYALEDPDGALAAIRQVLSTGEPVYSRLIRTVADGRSGHRYFSASAFRLARPGGEVIGVAVTLLDVTRRERDSERGEAVSRVRQRVGRSLSLVRTCEDLARTLSPGFADIVLVTLAEQVTAGDNPPPIAPVDAARLLLRPMALRTGGEAAAVPNIEDIGDFDFVAQESSFVQAITGRQPVLRAPRHGERLVDVAEHDRVLRDAGAHSLVVIPLTVHSRLLGLAVLVRCGASARFLRADLHAAEEIGLHTALCLENARRSAVARAIASTVQRRFLPDRPRSELGVDTAFVALSPPSRTGAWFDVIPLSGARCALVTGEMGRGGMTSLTAMGQLRTTLRALADLELQPDEVLARLSDSVARMTKDPGGPVDGASGAPVEGPALLVACTYGVYDPATSVLTIAGAGQPPPRVIGPDGAVVRLREATGPYLGTTDPEPFAMATHTVPEHATLLLASRDFDAALGPDEEIRQLLLATSSAADLANGLFVKMAPQKGRSGTAMLARTTRLGADRTVAWDLPAREEAVAEARRLAREWLRQQPSTAATEAADETLLLVSELVTNAVRYGVPPIRLRLTLNGALTVEVVDCGTAAPNLRHARVTDEGGRGLLIVSHLSDKWGTRQTGEGKAVWAERPLPA